MKIIGHCTLCEGCVYDIIERYPNGSLLAGEPRKLGAPRDNAVLVSYALSDESVMPLTFCADCLLDALTPDNFPRIWDIVMQAFKRELTAGYLVALGQPPRSVAHQAAVTDHVAALAAHCIIGAVGHMRINPTYKGAL